MKLLYITNGITGSGGLERVLSVKASLLAENYEYEVHILSLNETGKELFFSFSKKVNIHSIEVSGNPIQYLLKYKNGIQKLIDTIQPDVISVCDDALKGFLLPILIKIKTNLIHESHSSLLLGDKGTGVPLVKKIQHQLKQLLGKRFSKIVLLTQGNRKEWTLNNLEVIPNPLAFQTTQISSLQNKKIIAVGSYSYNKGYDLLLQIWAKIEKQFPDWQLNIYGKNTNQNLQSEAEKLNLKNINFSEPVENIKARYLESSIFVLPSRSEGFGMVLLEAMSCGLPMISFDCPNGPKDIITEDEDGFLIENGNVAMFAEKLKLLMDSENLRQEMGLKGFENVRRFEADKIVKMWDLFFKNITFKS